jgi:hypothetical protein
VGLPASTLWDELAHDLKLTNRVPTRDSQLFPELGGNPGLAVFQRCECPEHCCGTTSSSPQTDSASIAKKEATTKHQPSKQVTLTLTEISPTDPLPGVVLRLEPTEIHQAGRRRRSRENPGRGGARPTGPNDSWRRKGSRREVEAT